MDLSQYLEIFIDETKEHLQSLNDQVLILEAEPDNIDTINEIFRSAHSLKGMAGTMGFKRMQKLTHHMENIFSEIRNGKVKVKPDLVDIVFKCLDAIEGYLASVQESADEGSEDNEDLIAGLNACLEDEPSEEKAGKEKKTKAKKSAKTAKQETSVSEEKPDVAAENNNAESLEEKSKYLSINLNEHDYAAFEEAKANDFYVYGITVYINEDCILKAARAFLVFKALEELGETIKCSPEVPDIEDERFDFDFSLLLVTEHSIADVKYAIENVSEIKEAVVGDFIMDQEMNQETNDYEEEQEADQDIDQESEQNSETSADTVKKKGITAKAGKAVTNRSVRVDIEKLDDLMNLVSELIIAKNGLVSVNKQDDTNNVAQLFNEQIEYLERVTTNLHESVMKVRMVPIESVVNRFPRMIRDLSKKLGKEIDLVMTGEDTELDRTVIDEIGDPLMHMLRNSADHGLESTEERIKLGKPEFGTIGLNAYQDGNNVTIEVIDDGKGIDAEKVKRAAIEKGHISEEVAETLSQKEAIDLLFRPAFSTAKKISDVSGRGVGLDVVKNKIEGLGGDVEVDTTPGEGSKFTIRLPLTLAIIQALMVEVKNEKYAIPLNSIVTVEDILPEDVKFVQQREVINLRGVVVPLIRLDNLLDCELSEEEPKSLIAVIVKKGERQAGLVIDNLLGQQEIVIKPIGKILNVHKVISGATILGDGEVALIIDTNSLV